MLCCPVFYNQRVVGCLRFFINSPMPNLGKICEKFSVVKSKTRCGTFCWRIVEEKPLRAFTGGMLCRSVLCRGGWAGGRRVVALLDLAGLCWCAVRSGQAGGRSVLGLRPSPGSISQTVTVSPLTIRHCLSH